MPLEHTLPPLTLEPPLYFKDVLFFFKLDWIVYSNAGRFLF